MSFSFSLKCLVAFVAVLPFGASQGNSACGDDSWVPFKDEKCFKLLSNLATADQAATLCEDETSGDASPLLTLKSAEEQEFVTKLVFDDSAVVDNVWIAARRRNSSGQFEWNENGLLLEFTNWAPGSPSDDVAKGCVQMASHLSKRGASVMADGDGLWSDVSCLRSNRVLCQKQQTLSIAEIQRVLLDSRKRILDLETNTLELEAQIVKLESNPVPIGFIHVQFPNQPVPSSLWPKVVWEEITSNYAGLFFRAVGGESAAFGTTQADQSPRLTNAKWSFGDYQSVGISPGVWSDYLLSGSLVSSPYSALSFLVSSGEVRPRNTGIRIWTRKQ